MSTRVWLVRHGETQWNADRRLSGRTDIALTDAGRDQALGLKPLVVEHEFQGVWSSDLRRAVETARLAYGEARTDIRLREIDFGELEGSLWHEIPPVLQEALLAFDGFIAPGGESMSQMKARVRDFLDELDPGEHLVFTHGGVVRLVLRECGADRFPENSEIIVIDWANRAVIDVYRPGSGI